MSGSYVKQGFKNGQVLKAEHLIKMEEGIIKAQENSNKVTTPDLAVNDPNDPAYVKNRTHYVEEGPVLITWDGDITKVECVYSRVLDGSSTIGLYYVSDATCSNEELKNATVVVTAHDSDGSMVTGTNNMSDIWDDLLADGSITDEYVVTEAFVMTRIDNYVFSAGDNNITFPKAGLYFHGVVVQGEDASGAPVSGTMEWVSEINIPNVVRTKKLDQKFVPNADWNVNDVNADGYVKNRTHYTEQDELIISWDGNLSEDDIYIDFSESLGEEVPEGSYAGFVRIGSPIPSRRFPGLQLTLYIQEGSEVEEDTTTIPDESYEEFVEAGYITDDYAVVPPYFFIIYKDNITVPASVAIFGEVTFSKAGVYSIYEEGYFEEDEFVKVYIKGVTSPERIVKLDPKYLPGTFIGQAGEGYHAEVFNDPANIAVGTGSHAEGRDTKAYGDYSHSEGFDSITVGESSHAEGRYTAAIGDYSHAEGVADEFYNPVLNYLYGSAGSTQYTCQHQAIYAKPGDVLVYNDKYAVITAVKDSVLTVDRTLSETEDIYARNVGRIYSGGVAVGDGSHVEGYHTIASGYNQHVQGRYNVNDTENKYAHIVGNGDSYSMRSNAHTLDWDGNAWFAKNIYVGGNAQDDPGMIGLIDTTETVISPEIIVSYTGNSSGIAEIPFSASFELIPGEVYEVTIGRSTKYYWKAMTKSTDTHNIVYLGDEKYTISVLTDIGTGNVTYNVTVYDIGTTSGWTAYVYFTIKTVKRTLNEQNFAMLDIFETEVLSEMTVEINNALLPSGWGYTLETPFIIEVGKTYTVVWDGVEYDCVGTALGTVVVLGNIGEASSIEPFNFLCDVNNNDYTVTSLASSGTHTFSIVTKGNKIKKIKEEYIPDSVYALIDELRVEIETLKAQINNS